MKTPFENNERVRSIGNRYGQFGTVLGVSQTDRQFTVLVKFDTVPDPEWVPSSTLEPAK